MCSKRFRSSYCRKLDREGKKCRPNFLYELARKRLKQRLSLPRQVSKAKPIRFRPTVLNTWERVKSKLIFFPLFFFPFFSLPFLLSFPHLFKICLHSSFSPFYVQKEGENSQLIPDHQLLLQLLSECFSIHFVEHCHLRKFSYIYSPCFSAWRGSLQPQQFLLRFSKEWWRVACFPVPSETRDIRSPDATFHGSEPYDVTSSVQDPTVDKNQGRGKIIAWKLASPAWTHEVIVKFSRNFIILQIYER